MNRIVHISDLHFGRLNLGTVQPLLKTLNALRPDVVVVSGDLTQRAKETEFQDARNFLEQIDFPKVIVPGNHDVPLYQVSERLLKPLKRFDRYITSEREPTFYGSECVVFGINTAHGWTLDGGRVTKKSINKIGEIFSNVGEGMVKVVVSHHPFDAALQFGSGELVRGASRTIKKFEDLGVDVLLSGHLHIHHSGSTVHRHTHIRKHMIVAQSGTTISTRIRTEPASFNVLEITRSEVIVQMHSWNAEMHEFCHFRTDVFRKGQEGWER